MTLENGLRPELAIGIVEVDLAIVKTAGADDGLLTGHPSNDGYARDVLDSFFPLHARGRNIPNFDLLL